jgi:putative ABC transport system ATP-binding protein
MTSRPPAIAVQSLRKVYGHGNTEVIALRDANFELYQGQIAALLGPSGAGKSTLLSAIGLINKPTSGSIRIAGELVMDGPKQHVDLRDFRRRYIGYVFQKANLIPFLSALENVQIAQEINGITGRKARARAMELLEYLGVADRAPNMPHMLSGGQQQRIAVARALANHPRLILADEPTAALDSFRGRQVMELFRQVAREQGASVLVVTHDHRSLDVFDRTFEMLDGALEESTVAQASNATAQA